MSTLNLLDTPACVHPCQWRSVAIILQSQQNFKVNDTIPILMMRLRAREGLSSIRYLPVVLYQVEYHRLNVSRRDLCDC